MPLKRALRGLAAWMLVGLVCALALEGLVRVFLPQVLPLDAPELWEPSTELGWRHRRQVDLLVNTGEREVRICTDALGDRVDCDAVGRKRCKRRILVLGDSYVEALAIPYRESVWSHIEKDTGACVFAAGVGGYGLAQYLATARQRLASAKVPYDLVVLNLYVGNDFTRDAEQVPPTREVQRRPLRLLPEALETKALRDWFYPYNAWLESRSHAYVALRFSIRRFQDPADVGVFGVPGAIRKSWLTSEVVAETARGIRLISREVSQRGARFLLTIIPFRSQVLDPTGAALIAALPRLTGDIDMDLAQKRLGSQLQSLSEAGAVVDLLPALREAATEQAWGAYDRHFTPDGHRLWFEAVRTPLRRLLELDRGGTGQASNSPHDEWHQRRDTRPPPPSRTQVPAS